MFRLPQVRSLSSHTPTLHSAMASMASTSPFQSPHSRKRASDFSAARSASVDAPLAEWARLCLCRALALPTVSCTSAACLYALRACSMASSGSPAFRCASARKRWHAALPLLSPVSEQIAAASFAALVASSFSSAARHASAYVRCADAVRASSPSSLHRRTSSLPIFRASPKALSLTQMPHMTFTSSSSLCTSPRACSASCASLATSRASATSSWSSSERARVCMRSAYASPFLSPDARKCLSPSRACRMACSVMPFEMLSRTTAQKASTSCSVDWTATASEVSAMSARSRRPAS
mmetsp:Transcript_14540/g.31624  ORF Transcript_14540/g.31624 Transcript_14540/m.31624 type:complete len:295 (-) Transcript_14540:46-930(-)